MIEKYLGGICIVLFEDSYMMIESVWETYALFEDSYND